MSEQDGTSFDRLLAQIEERTAASRQHGPVGTPLNSPENQPDLISRIARRTKELIAEKAAKSPSPPEQGARHPGPLVAGIGREIALGLYAETVNQEDTLFSDDGVLPGRLQELRLHLHGVITSDEALALNDVLYRRRRWEDMLAWLREPSVSWEKHFVREAIRAEEADRLLNEYLRGQDEKWANGTLPSPLLDWGWSPEQIAEFERTNLEDAKTRYLERAKPCPGCGTPAESLEWFHYVSPPSCWRTVFAGWKTRCQVCSREVDYFQTAIGRGRRPEIPAPTDEQISRAEEDQAACLEAYDREGSDGLERELLKRYPDSSKLRLRSAAPIA